MSKILTILPILMVLFIGCGQKIEETKKSTDSFNQDDSDSNTKVNTLAIKKEQLNIALKANSFTMVQPALQNFNNLNFKFKDGESPLTLAVSGAKEEIVTLVLKHTVSIDVNYKNQSGETPTHIATKNNHKEILLKLIRNGADVNINNAQGMPPLITALGTLNQRFALILITNGASIDVKDKNGFSVSQLADLLNLRKLQSLIKFIKGHKNINNKKLNDAVKTGSMDIVEYLLNNYEEYSDLIQIRNVLLTAMKIEDEDLKVKIIRKLIAAGADVNNTEGVTPLVNATIKNDYIIVRLLLEYGANPLLPNEEDLTALDYAAESMNYPVMKALVTPLYSAFDEDDAESFELDMYLESACDSLPPVNSSKRRDWEVNRNAIKIFNLLDCLYRG